MWEMQTTENVLFAQEKGSGLECPCIAGHQLTSTHTPLVCQHKEHCKRTYDCVTVSNGLIRLSFIHTSKSHVIFFIIWVFEESSRCSFQHNESIL